MRYLEFYMIHAKGCGENFKIIHVQCAKIIFSQVKKMEVNWKVLEVLNVVWGGNDNMDNVSFFFLNEWHSSHNVVFLFSLWVEMV